MDKRYQVFISSTFTDLKEERQGVLRAILELDHMPAGMELFPAADDSAWQLIKDVIDASDYYVVMIGGRYGSLDENGIGYTEKEYDYAISAGKPVIPLLHERPDNLPREKTDTDPPAWRKLQAFRAKVEERHTCAYWASAEQLKARVIVALTAAVKRHPGVGWVRADQVPSEATLADVLALRNRIAELEAQATADRLRPPEGTEELLQGDDEFEIDVTFTVRQAGAREYSATSCSTQINATWNQIFADVAPLLISEGSDRDLRQALHTFFSRRMREVLGETEDFKGMVAQNFAFPSEEIDTCIVQLRALGLIRESMRQRGLRDTNRYWCLTPYGDHLMTRLRALRRTPLPSAQPERSEPRAGTVCVDHVASDGPAPGAAEENK